MLYYNAASDFISVDLVQNVVRDLKRGKAAGLASLMADHIYFAHPVLLVYLSCLFTMLCKHSVVPGDLRTCIVISLFNNVDGNRFTTDNNYR